MLVSLSKSNGYRYYVIDDNNGVIGGYHGVVGNNDGVIGNNDGVIGNDMGVLGDNDGRASGTIRTTRATWACQYQSPMKHLLCIGDWY